MARYSINLIADSTGVYVCDIKKSREYWCWFATLAAYGSSFGGGTLTWYWTDDKGTTLIPFKDITDTAVSQTTNGGVNVQLGSGNTNSDNSQIWVKMAGSTNPVVKVLVLDNRS